MKTTMKMTMTDECWQTASEIALLLTVLIFVSRRTELTTACVIGRYCSAHRLGVTLKIVACWLSETVYVVLSYILDMFGS